MSMETKKNVKSRLRSRFIIGFAYAIAIVGCDNVQRSGRPSPKAQLPEIGGGTAEVAGTSATFGVWGDGLAVVVWSKVRAQGASSGTSGERAHYSGRHRASDGSRIDWECVSEDGKRGTIGINGEDFDLEDGSLFIVAVDGEQTVVRQMQRDTLQLTLNDLAQTLDDWRENDLEIMQWLRVSR